MPVDITWQAANRKVVEPKHLHPRWKWSRDLSSGPRPVTPHVSANRLEMAANILTSNIIPSNGQVHRCPDNKNDFGGDSTMKHPCSLSEHIVSVEHNHYVGSLGSKSTFQLSSSRKGVVVTLSHGCPGKLTFRRARLSN